METWKAFDHNVISHSAAHHLMAIDELLLRHGYARVSDVARQLNITRGSVSISLQPLKKAGLILQDENRHLRLSSQGQRLVDAIKTKRFLMQRLLSDVLGVSAAQAEVDACKMEHLISSETAKRIIAMLKFFDTGQLVAREFLAAMRAFDSDCGGQTVTCQSCQTSCLAETISE